MTRPTERQFTTSLYLLRALQVGLKLPDLEFLDMGDVYDILTEAGNDNCHYKQLATQSDFDKF